MWEHKNEMTRIARIEKPKPGKFLEASGLGLPRTTPPGFISSMANRRCCAVLLFLNAAGFCSVLQGTCNN